MATFTSTSGSYTTTLTVTQTSQSTQNNQSTLTYSLTLTKNSGTGLWNNNSCPWSITIDGSTVASGSFTYDFRSYSSLTLKGSTTTTVTHNSDGTKTVACSASVNMDNEPYVYVMKPSGDLALTTIPRASDVSVSNYSIANTSGSISATITSKASFYHKWRWRMNSGSWSSWTNKGLIASTSSTVTVANTTLLAQLPTATSGSFNIEVATYSDSGYATLVGTKSASATVSVNTANIKPSVSLGNIGLNSTPIANYAVAGYSKVQSAWTTTNSSGASSVTTYFTTSHGSLATTSSTSTSGTTVSGVIPSSSANYTLTISAYAKDSRGATSSTVSKSITVYGYTPPTATLNAYRVASSSSTTEDGAGTYAYVTFSGAVSSSVNNQNSIQSTTCTYSGSISGTATNGGHYALADTQTVTFTLTVRDKVTSSTTAKTIATASYPLDLYDNGSGSVGVGLGTVAEGNFVKIGAGIHTKGNWLTTFVTVSDLNQIAEGIVYFNPSVANTPCSYGVCYTLGLDGDNAATTWYSQIVFGTNGIIYFRNSINTMGQTWSNWSSFYGAFNPQTTIANADNATNASNVSVVNKNVTAIETFYGAWVNNLSTSHQPIFANNGFIYRTLQGTASSQGFSILQLGNVTATGTDGNKTGQILLYGNKSKYIQLAPVNDYVDNYTFYLYGRTGIGRVYLNLWSGTCYGGATVSVDMSGWDRIKVYAVTWGVQHIFDIDLSHTPNAGIVDSGYPFQSGSMIPMYAGTNNTGTMEYHGCMCKVSSDKKTFWATTLGYAKWDTNSGTWVWTTRNSVTQYYVYRIDGVM